MIYKQTLFVLIVAITSKTNVKNYFGKIRKLEEMIFLKKHRFFAFPLGLALCLPELGRKQSIKPNGYY